MGYLDNRRLRLIQLARKPLLTAPDIQEILECGRNKAYNIARYLRETCNAGVPFMRGAIRAEVFWSQVGTTSERYLNTLLKGTQNITDGKED